MSKSEIEYEEKVRIVRSYLSGEVGYNASVKAANNNAKSFREWHTLYKAGGAAALKPKEKKKIYSPELKLQAVKIYRRKQLGENMSSIRNQEYQYPKRMDKGISCSWGF